MEKDSEGKTALHHAAEKGHALVVELLIADSDIDKNVQDNDSKTALHYATQGKHKNTIKVLLAETGIDRNIRDAQNNIPQELANGDSEIMELFLAESAKAL